MAYYECNGNNNYIVKYYSNVAKEADTIKDTPPGWSENNKTTEFYKYIIFSGAEFAARNPVKFILSNGELVKRIIGDSWMDTWVYKNIPIGSYLTYSFYAYFTAIYVR